MFRLIILLLIVSLSDSTGLRAQSVTTISGIVTDQVTGRPLEGVNIILEETNQGTSTGRDGRYAFEQITPGQYTLIMRMIGYETVEEFVVIQNNVPHTVDLELHRTTIHLGEVLARADRPYSAASSTTIRAFDLITRPVQSSQDLLKLTPGLVTAQHAGGGKAEQIFLRGFDADHGTDVAISVDGIPVNMVSHGHGQGYADLHFLIPEIVERIEVNKGPYEARQGNLATAGSISFQTKDHLEHNLIQLSGGRFNTMNLTALYKLPVPATAHQGAYFGGQFYQSDGPVVTPQGFQRFNLFGKFHTHLSEEAKLSVSVSGFSSAWDASGQIPQRAIETGLIERFGSIDDLEGGTTGRQDVNMVYTARQGNEEFNLQGYATRYNFKLFSNFTFFLDDPLNGDMIEQTDNRRLVGVNSHYRFTRNLGATLSTTTFGGGFRADDATVSLWKSPNRTREEALVNADVTERNVSLWISEELIHTSWLRLQLGLRGDYFTFSVEDYLEGSESDLPHASGYAQQSLLSPKASLVLSPFSTLDVFANFGNGFHSNDARAIVQGRRVADLIRVYQRQGLVQDEINKQLLTQQFDPSQATTGTLPRATGSELGLRYRLSDNMFVSAAAWLLDLDDEFVYVGDAGFTELSGRSRRYGLDLEARLSLTSWLSADADVNLSRGFLKDEPSEANAIPLAPRLTSTGGLTVIHPGGLEASLRYIHIGDRPANETGSVTAQGYTLLSLFAAYPLGPVKLSILLENALDVDWNEAQFDTESRLPGEALPVSELHFTPGSPRALRIGLSYIF